SETSTLATALAAGAVALFGVHWMMRTIYRLRVDGTARIERTVGQTGTVYLRIPGKLAGPGKVHVTVDNRLLEYEAMTASEPLPSGALVRVLRIVGPETLEVEAVASA